MFHLAKHSFIGPAWLQGNSMWAAHDPSLWWGCKDRELWLKIVVQDQPTTGLMDVSRHCPLIGQCQSNAWKRSAAKKAPMPLHLGAWKEGFDRWNGHMKVHFITQRNWLLGLAFLPNRSGQQIALP